MAPWFLGISPEGIGTVGMILNFIATIAVTMMTPARRAHPDLVEHVRIPRGAGAAAAAH